MEPTWDLVIPSPLRAANLLEDNSVKSHRPVSSNSNNTPEAKRGGMSGNSFSIVDPITPLSQKLGTAVDEPSPQNYSMHTVNIGASGESVAAANRRQKQHLLFPKVFIPNKNCSASDLKELDASVIATIEKNRETYICLHDVADYVAQKLANNLVQKNWRHYDERTFLFAFPDRHIRDKFLQTNRELTVGDAVVTFKAWKPASGAVKKPCTFKVWLRLIGLPIEHFCHVSCERVVSSFGRLYKCNLEKKATFVGAFYVMIDCPDLDDIKPRVLIQTDNDSEIPVFVDKLYACPLDVYNSQPFRDNQMAYDDILGMMRASGKLLLLQ